MFFNLRAIECQWLQYTKQHTLHFSTLHTQTFLDCEPNTFAIATLLYNSTMPLPIGGGETPAEPSKCTGGAEQPAEQMSIATDSGNNASAEQLAERTVASGTTTTAGENEYIWTGVPLRVLDQNAILAAPLGDKDPTISRKQAFDLVQPDRIEGFDAQEMELVIPNTPFVSGTTEHLEDKGMHLTLLQSDQITNSLWYRPAGSEKTTEDDPAKNDKKIIPEKMDIGVKLDEIILLEGQEKNDVACGLVSPLPCRLDITADPQ